MLNPFHSVHDLDFNLLLQITKKKWRKLADTQEEEFHKGFKDNMVTHNDEISWPHFLYANFFQN